MMFYETQICLPVWVFYAALLLLGAWLRQTSGEPQQSIGWNNWLKYAEIMTA